MDQRDQALLKVANELSAMAELLRRAVSQPAENDFVAKAPSSPSEAFGEVPATLTRSSLPTDLLPAPGAVTADSSILPDPLSPAQEAIQAFTLAEDCQEVFRAWQQIFRKESGLSASRKQVIMDRLREGLPKETIIRALRGVTLSPWHMADNPTKQPLVELKRIIGNQEQVLRFADMWSRQLPLPSFESITTRMRTPADLLREYLGR